MKYPEREMPAIWAKIFKDNKVTRDFSRFTKQTLYNAKPNYCGDLSFLVLSRDWWIRFEPWLLVWLGRRSKMSSLLSCFFRTCLPLTIETFSMHLATYHNILSNPLAIICTGNTFERLNFCSDFLYKTRVSNHDALYSKMD